MVLEDDTDEAFAQGLAYGFTPLHAAQHAGADWSPVEAAHYSTRQEIVDRVKELTETQMFDASLEHLRVARQLEVDRDFAYACGNPAAAINATVQRAKLLGVYVERLENKSDVVLSSPNQLTPEEWAQRFGGSQTERESDGQD